MTLFRRIASGRARRFFLPKTTSPSVSPAEKGCVPRHLRAPVGLLTTPRILWQELCRGGEGAGGLGARLFDERGHVPTGGGAGTGGPREAHPQDAGALSGTRPGRLYAKPRRHSRVSEVACSVFAFCVSLVGVTSLEHGIVHCRVFTRP